MREDPTIVERAFLLFVELTIHISHAMRICDAETVCIVLV